MKGIAIFFGIFLALMALLLFAKTRPAQAAAPFIASKIFPSEGSEQTKAATPAA